MIGKTRSDGWGSLYPAEAMAVHPLLQAQALVLGAEDVDTAHQIREWLQDCGLRISARLRRTRTARQERKVAFSRSMKAVLSLVLPWLFFQQPLSSFRTAMRYQGHYDDHPTNDAFGRMATRSLQQRPYHIFALVTCFFSAVNNDNVLTYFAPCRVGHIGAELLSRAHVAYAFQVVEPLECHKDLHFFNLHVLLECYHTHRRML